MEVRLYLKNQIREFGSFLGPDRALNMTVNDGSSLLGRARDGRKGKDLREKMDLLANFRGRIFHQLFQLLECVKTAFLSIFFQIAHPSKSRFLQNRSPGSPDRPGDQLRPP